MFRRLLAVALVLALVLIIGVKGEPIRVLTPFGTPMKDALVEVTKLDGTTIRGYLDSEGAIRVREVPLGIVRLRIISWKGFTVNFSVTVTIHNTTVTCGKIGKLIIQVISQTGQPVPYATIIIKNSEAEVHGLSDQGGVFMIELPEGDYEVRVIYASKEAKVGVHVMRAKEAAVKVVLPFFLIVGGVPLDLWLLVGIIVVAAVIVLVIGILLYELRHYIYMRKLKIIPSK